MIFALRKTLSGLILTFGLIVALAATGFAHHAPSLSDTSKMAFVLAGGQASDLCSDADMDDKPSQDCPACHLVGAAVIPTVDLPILTAELAFQAKVIAPRESRALRAVRDPAHGLRAPPIA